MTKCQSGVHCYCRVQHCHDDKCVIQWQSLSTRRSMMFISRLQITLCQRIWWLCHWVFCHAIYTCITKFRGGIVNFWLCHCIVECQHVITSVLYIEKKVGLMRICTAVGYSSFRRLPAVFDCTVVNHIPTFGTDNQCYMPVGRHNAIIFSWAGWAFYISWSKCCLCVLTSVWMLTVVEQIITGTHRLVTFHAQHAVNESDLL